MYLTVTLDVSKNTALRSLYCDGNQLTSLDVSNNTALTLLDCSPMIANGVNQLATLFIYQGQVIPNITTNRSIDYIPAETQIIAQYNSEHPEPNGNGTLEDPYNPAAAAAAVVNLTWTSTQEYQTTGEVYVRGKISRIASKGTFTEGGSYGNASFYIVEEGTGFEFFVYRTLYLGNKKFESGQTDIKIGDEVIICGKLMNYRGYVPETEAINSYIYSLNGITVE